MGETSDEEEEDKPQTFEDLLQRIGNKGKFQILLYLCGEIIEGAAGTCMLYFIFEGANPGWNCNGHEYVLQNGTVGNLSIISSDTTQGCNADYKPCKNGTFNSEYSSIVTEWTLICDQAYQAKLTASLFFIGVLIGSFVAGQLSDIFGRKTVLMVFWAGVILFQLSLIWAPSWKIYTILRFFVGLSVGSVITVVFVVTTEYIHPSWRSLMTYKISWTIFPSIMDLIAYLTRDWRKTCMGAALTTAPFYIIFLFIFPESARWLVQKGKTERATFWLNKVAWCNGKPKLTEDEVKRVVLYEKSLKQKTTQYTYLDLFRSPALTKRTLTILYAWFCISMLYYGINSQLSSLPGSLFVNMLIVCTNTAAVRWTTVLLLNCLGRKKTYPILMALTSVMFLILMILDLTGVRENHGIAVTVLALIAMCISTGCWACSAIYAAENYPTLMRNIAYGAGNTSARISGAIAPQIALLGQYFSTVPFIIFFIIAITSGLLTYKVLPETKGKPLPESLPNDRWPCFREVKKYDLTEISDENHKDENDKNHIV